MDGQYHEPCASSPGLDGDCTRGRPDARARVGGIRVPGICVGGISSRCRSRSLVLGTKLFREVASVGVPILYRDESGSLVLAGSLANVVAYVVESRLEAKQRGITAEARICRRFVGSRKDGVDAPAFGVVDRPAVKGTLRPLVIGSDLCYRCRC